MNILRKALSPLTGVAVAVVAIGIAVPPAARAVAAALVQVSNTPTNAVPTMHAPAETQLYSASCSTSVLDGLCYLTSVPAGHTLFIESMSIFASVAHGTKAPSFSDVVTTISGTSNSFVFPLAPVSADSSAGGLDTFEGAVGARIYSIAGSTPYCVVGGAQSYSCSVYGYLAPSN